MTPEDITTFIRRLDKVMASRSKTKAKQPAVATPKTPNSAANPNIEVENSTISNGSPGTKKLTYV